MKQRRVVAVLTHPVQYFSPWFREIQEHHSEIDFTAVYATSPDAHLQGVGFGKAFSWDVPLLAGYSSVVLRPCRSTDDVHSSRFLGVDAPILSTLKRLKPDAVLINGWHSIFQVRALFACRRLGIPAIYRGDTTLVHEPSGVKGVLWSLKTKALLRNGFDAYLSVGTRSREYLLRMGVGETRIFDSPHCVDNDFFQARSEAARLARPSPKDSYGLSGRFVALFAGKLEAIKRPTDVLAAVARLGEDWGALFVGAGPLESHLKSEADRLGVRANFAGFHNQSEMGRAYAAADVFVLPSSTETWGLAVNEALACGVPCVVSDGVGCAPDLVKRGETGDVFPVGDSASLATALEGVRRSLLGDPSVIEQCRAIASKHSFRMASLGLVDAVNAVARTNTKRSRGVVAIAGTMAFPGGLERQTFQVLEVLRRSDRPVHVIGNGWARDPETGVHPFEQMSVDLGASWTVGSYFLPLSIAKNPLGALKLFAEFLSVGKELVDVVQSSGAKTIFFPDYGTVLRNIFGLIWLRWRGIRTVLRIGNAPERKSWHEWMWRRLLPPFVDLFVANSEFGARRLRECGVPERKIRCIKNALSVRSSVGDAEIAAAEVVGRRCTVLCVGQMTPFKGPHLLLEAAERLLAKGRDFQVAFLGRRPDWPLEYVKFHEDLELRSRRGVLAGRVHFLGEVTNVQHVMRHAWLLAAPIIQEETFGNVVLEALAVGLPSVVTPRGGLVELVEHRRTGYLCEGADVDSLVEGLDWFLAEKGRRSAASRECLAVSKRSDWPYSRERYESAWLDVFSETIVMPIDGNESETKESALRLRVVG